jgi:hypothetical protein
MNWIEGIGYVASALVALSLMMGNIWRLRWVNLAGAVVFATYGLLIQSWPVVAMNAFIVVIDIYHIVKLTRRSDAMSFLEVNHDTPFLRRFLEYWAVDLAQFFPDFTPSALTEARVRLVLRNMMPVGIFAFQLTNAGTARVVLDYVVPEWRDLRAARFVYSAPHDDLVEAGAVFFEAETTVAQHRNYLKKMGFAPVPGKADTYHRHVGRGAPAAPASD